MHNISTRANSHNGISLICIQTDVVAGLSGLICVHYFSSCTMLYLIIQLVALQYALGISKVIIYQ